MRYLVPAAVSFFLICITICSSFVIISDTVYYFAFRNSSEEKIENIKRIELVVKHSHNARSNSKLEIDYSYKFQGVKFSSRRSSVHLIRDNFDGFHRKTFQKMKEDEINYCWHTNNLGLDAVLSKEYRFPTLFINLVFLIVPGVLSWFFVRASIFEYARN